MKNPNLRLCWLAQKCCVETYWEPLFLSEADVLRVFGYSAKLLKLPKPVQARLEDGSGLLFGLPLVHHRGPMGSCLQFAKDPREQCVVILWWEPDRQQTYSLWPCPIPKAVAHQLSAMKGKFYNDWLFDFFCNDPISKMECHNDFEHCPIDLVRGSQCGDMPTWLFCHDDFYKIHL